MRRRVMGFVLAVVANLLILLMLLKLAPYAPRLLAPEARLTTFSLQPEPGTTHTSARTESRVKRSSGGAPPHPAAPATPPPPVRPPVEFPKLLDISREAVAATDIAMRTQHPAKSAPAGSGEGAGTGSDSGLAEGPGETGPGGQRLYNAEWYRHPTDAELAYYLPANAPHVGWGVVACRTIANYRVEDCVELGESPTGSGLSRAVRQAAWQFMVRPPRVGGHAMVGEWVRIKIDYRESSAK